MVRITEDKVEKLADKVGKALRYMGEAMSCIDKMQNGSDYDEMGERRPWDYRDINMPRAQYREESQNRFRDDGRSYTPMMGERGSYGNRGGNGGGGNYGGAGW